MSQVCLDWCVLHNADNTTLSIALDAIDGNAKDVRELWSYRAIEAAHSALDGCRKLGCSAHGDERSALKLLGDLMFELECEEMEAAE